MANTTFLQKDLSRFQIRSYGWRGVDINTDRAINLLEQAFQTAKGIDGIASALRQGMGDGDMDDGTLNHYQMDQLFSAIDQLSNSLMNNLCRYAAELEQLIGAVADASSSCNVARKED